MNVIWQLITWVAVRAFPVACFVQSRNKTCQTQRDSLFTDAYRKENDQYWSFSQMLTFCSSLIKKWNGKICLLCFCCFAKWIWYEKLLILWFCLLVFFYFIYMLYIEFQLFIICNKKKYDTMIYLLTLQFLAVYKETIKSLEADLARSIPQSGTQDVNLQPEDFVVSVSF